MGSLRGAACLLLAHAGAAAEVSFERHDIDLGTPHFHVALAGGYLGGEFDDIAVFEVDEDNARTLTVHALRGAGEDLAWRALHRHAVGEDVIFVESVALAGGGDGLLIGRRGTLSWLDPVSGGEEGFVEFPTIYNVAPLEELPRVEVARDIDGDDIDDIAIADFDGYWIVRQREDGSWRAPVKVPVSAGVSGGFAWSYRPRAAYPLDYDGDGLDDLAFWDRGELLVHDATGEGYAGVPRVVDLGLDLASDERTVRLAFGGDDDEEARTLWGMSDYNGDGVADVAVQAVVSSGVLSKETRYTLHLGRMEGGRTMYRPEPDAAFVSDGLQFLDHVDVNGDGVSEFLLITVRVSVPRIIAALLTGSFPVDADIYAASGGEYSQEPSWSRRFRFEFSLSEGTASMPGAALADVTGDGLKDAVLVSPGEGLVVQEGVGTSAVIGERTHSFDFPLAAMGGRLEARDFDDDGREDLLIRTGAGQEPKGLTLMLSR